VQAILDVTRIVDKGPELGARHFIDTKRTLEQTQVRIDLGGGYHSGQREARRARRHNRRCAVLSTQDLGDRVASDYG
jgi:hypothetical protein